MESLFVVQIFTGFVAQFKIMKMAQLLFYPTIFCKVSFNICIFSIRPIFIIWMHLPLDPLLLHMKKPQQEIVLDQRWLIRKLLSGSRERTEIRLKDRPTEVIIILWKIALLSSYPLSSKSLFYFSRWGFPIIILMIHSRSDEFWFLDTKFGFFMFLCYCLSFFLLLSRHKHRVFIGPQIKISQIEFYGFLIWFMSCAIVKRGFCCLRIHFQKSELERVFETLINLCLCNYATTLIHSPLVVNNNKLVYPFNSHAIS